MSWGFENRTVVITGGGNGIGRASAIAFAQNDARVAVLDRDLAAAEQTCAFANNGINLARAWRCDVASESDILDTVSAVIHEFSGIDILFNNAGVNRRIKLADWKADDWNALIQVNLIGVFCVARAVGLHMVERGRGSIVNMSALGGGIIGLGRGTEIYTATKGRGRHVARPRRGVGALRRKGKLRGPRLDRYSDKRGFIEPPCRSATSDRPCAPS